MRDAASFGAVQIWSSAVNEFCKQPTLAATVGGSASSSIRGSISGSNRHAAARLVLAASSDAGDSGTTTLAPPEQDIQEKTRSRTATPPLYRVLLINDDFTPMDFVILVLQKFFQKGIDEASQIMLQIHHQGSGLCGIFTFEIAETKVYQVNQYSRQNRHPLKCVMEKA